MTEESHSYLYEKIGKLDGRMEGFIRTQEEQGGDIKEIKKLLQDNTKTLTSLKTRVATISGGIATVSTLAITFVWNSLLGKE